MKKIAIVTIVFLVLLSGLKVENKFSLLNYYSGEYIVYTASKTTEDGVNLGFCHMESKPTYEGVMGESMVMYNIEVGAIIKDINARVVKTEYLEDGTTIIYAFTNLINDNVKIDGKVVNFQIAIKDERVVVGWPLILGSY